MKALVYHGERDIRYESFDDPGLHADTDAIVKVDKCAICGSDLHIYHGEGFSEETGYCVGHEAVGEVVETGKGLQRLNVGDKVMIPAPVGCGNCRSCIAGNVLNCENNASTCYGLSPALQGSQAEFVRVPAADYNAELIPDGVSDEQALMLTDALPTAWLGARMANIKKGGTVCVIGLGPIGLLAIESAFIMGASRVFGIDLVEDRRALARELGAETPLPGQAKQYIVEATRGKKCESVIEAVGHGSTIRNAIGLAGVRSTVSIIGAPRDLELDLPITKIFAMGIKIHAGVCSVPEEWPALVPLIQSGRLKPEKYITNRMSLSDGAEAYRRFDAREDGVMKVIFDMNN